MYEQLEESLKTNNVNRQITITENGIYTFYVEDYAGNKHLEHLEITKIIPGDPTINVEYSTSSSNNNISKVIINYDSNCTSKFYKINEGEFNNYQDILTTVIYGDSITAYCTDDYGNESNKVTVKAEYLTTDKLVIDITENEWNKIFYYKFQSASSINIKVKFLDENEEIIDSFSHNYVYNDVDTSVATRNMGNLLTIPENTRYIKFDGSTPVLEYKILDSVTKEYPSTSFSNSYPVNAINEYIYINKTDWNKHIYLDIYTPQWGGCYVQFLDENDNIINIHGSSNNRIQQVIKIPENSVKIKLHYTGGTSSNVTVYDMFIFKMN